MLNSKNKTQDSLAILIPPILSAKYPMIGIISSLIDNDKELSHRILLGLWFSILVRKFGRDMKI